jgi:hypothetical protein
VSQVGTDPRTLIERTEQRIRIRESEARFARENAEAAAGGLSRGLLHNAKTAEQEVALLRDLLAALPQEQPCQCEIYQTCATCRGEAAAPPREHRFYCSRHGDYTKVDSRDCSVMAAECPECAKQREDYNAKNKDSRLGPAASVTSNRCWCRSARRHSGMGIFA